MKKLGVALIGCGGIGRIHAQSIRDSRYTIPKVSCDIVREKARQIQVEYGFETYTTDYEEVAKRDDVDVVIVAIPPRYHAEVSIKLLESGKHVLCEKPIATNLKDAWEMITKAQKSGVKLCIDYQNRYLPSYSKLKEIISSGILGEIIQIRARVAYSILHTIKPTDSMLRWLFNPGISGGGVLMDIGTHWTDLVRWLVNKDYVGIYALIGHFNPNIPNTIEDTATILARMTDDIQAIIDVSWATIGSKWPIEVYGDKGTAIADFPGRLEIYDAKKGEWEKIKVKPSLEPHFKLLNLFLRSIINDEEPPVTDIDAYKSLEAIIAAYESAKTRREVLLSILD